VFRSRRRDLVYPQLEHARLAAAIALAWGNETFPPPSLPRDPFVAGVALHDRGYSPLDADGIGEVPRERWLAIQRESFRPRGDDPVVDLVVALHVRRLIGWSRGAEEVAAELGPEVERLRVAAGVSDADAAAADRVTDMCDRIAFDFCFEEAAEGSLELPARDGGLAAVAYAIEAGGRVRLDPWPLQGDRLEGLAVGYAAAAYPALLEPVLVPYLLEPVR
jgi:uncharacterized protein DUF3891